MKLILSGIVSALLLASAFAGAQDHRHKKLPPPPLTPPGSSAMIPHMKSHPAPHHWVRRGPHHASHPLPRYNAKKHMWWIAAWADSKGHHHAGHWTKNRPR